MSGKRYLLLIMFWIDAGLICQTDSMTAAAGEPDILVVRDGWQEDRDTVRKVLESTARELSNRAFIVQIASKFGIETH